MRTQFVAAVFGLSFAAFSVSSQAAEITVGNTDGTAETSAQSFLRFTNTDTHAGTVTVGLRDEASGAVLGEWTSPVIPSGAEHQYSLTAIEAGAGVGGVGELTKPDNYALTVSKGVSGYLQHVQWNGAEGTLTNASTCEKGATASPTKLSGVHSSLLSESHSSTVVVHNTGAQDAAVTLAIYDANDGHQRGTYTTPVIASGAQAKISVEEIEAVVGAPAAGTYHYVIAAEAPFAGFLQHLVTNSETGETADMTATCVMGRAAAEPTSYVPAAMLGGTCEPGQTSMVGFMMICGSDSRFRYALPEDMPATPVTPEGGYTSRPAWYPPLGQVFIANNAPACPASGRIATMTNFIVPLNQLALSTPHGAMLGDHVTPIDHAYIALKVLDKPEAQRTEADYVSVTAPADGEIIEISNLGAPWTNRVVIAHGCETYSILMVMNRIAGVLAPYRDELSRTGRVSAKIQVRAGDVIGQQRDNPLDYSLHDGARWLPGYRSPYAYIQGEAWKPYTVDPAPYFSVAINTAVQDVMRRIPAPRWGKIDHDVARAAAGNWFLAGTAGYSGRSVESLRNATTIIQGGPVEGKNTYAWSHLSLSPYWNEPSQWVFSTGWWRDEKGDPQQWHLEVPRGKPTPPLLTRECGTVVYRLRQLVDFSQTPAGGNTMIAGVVALRMNADESLTVEIVPGLEDPTKFAGFSTAQRTYRR